MSMEMLLIKTQDTSTQLVRIGISLDSLCFDHSTIESPAGQINNEVLNKQHTKDDVRPEITTTGENTFKDVLYKIVKTYLKKTNAGFVEENS